MPAIDTYKTSARGPAGGPTHLALVTPSDSEDLAQVSQWVYLATDGTLKVTTRGGETLMTPVLVAGWHLMELTRIHATGTSATGIMVGW
ncbi:spike base protein, RCAP_Rcc01079 family [Ostreiculturibacter nitratireducens]|uniref:spike base protein, RCAP_Rcc01079 family n=1 Tax=Ostreiculturibacter nitratireducens TaxID=3075226 RepID=UPI0031B573F4